MTHINGMCCLDPDMSAMMVYGLMTGSMPMKETRAKSRPKNSGTSCVETQTVPRKE